MSFTMRRTSSCRSTYALVLISPPTRTRPVVVNVSHATFASGSFAKMASSTPSDTWSQSLSGCPSVTLSLVKRNRCDIWNAPCEPATHRLRTRHAWREYRDARLAYRVGGESLFRRAGIRRRVPARIDLHAHTLVSDGTLSPTQLVHAAAGAGLAAVAI